MQTQSHDPRTTSFTPMSRFDTFAPLKESLNRLIVSDAERSGLKSQNCQEALRSGTGEDSPITHQSLMGLIKCVQNNQVWPWSPPRIGDLKSIGATYPDEEGNTSYLHDMYTYGLLPPRLQLPAPSSSSLLTLPTSMMGGQRPSSYMLPPFACCEASLWRGRSEGLLAAAGQPIKDTGTQQPIVIHNETSARLQNDVMQEVTSAPVDPREARRAHNRCGYIAQRVADFFRSPLNVFTVGALCAVISYFSIRYAYMRRRESTLRRQRLLMRRAGVRTSPALFLSQLLARTGRGPPYQRSGVRMAPWSPYWDDDPR